MKSQKLPLEAEEIRKEIKTLISQITTVEEDENGNKKFGGDALLVLISRMKAALEIDVVSTNDIYFHGILLILSDLGRAPKILVEVYKAGPSKARVLDSIVGRSSGEPWGCVTGRIIHTSQ